MGLLGIRLLRLLLLFPRDWLEKGIRGFYTSSVHILCNSVYALQRAFTILSMCRKSAFGTNGPFRKAILVMSTKAGEGQWLLLSVSVAKTAV